MSQYTLSPRLATNADPNQSLHCHSLPNTLTPPLTHVPSHLLSRQRRQSLTLHCIANGHQTILQERKEFCSDIYQIMVTLFNCAADP